MEMENEKKGYRFAMAGIDTLRKLTESNDFWIKDEEGRDVLDDDKYQRTFPIWANKDFSSWTTEASRATAFVKMNHFELAQKLAEHEWSRLFSNVVANEKIAHVISRASPHTVKPGQTSSLRVLSREMQATSPVVPNRKLAVIKSCTQIYPRTWLISEVSPFSPNSYFCRLPSGCLIQGISDYVSKVTWVEHSKVIAESPPPNQTFYDHLLRTGFSSLADRMVAWLETFLERESHGILFSSMLDEVPWVDDMLTLMNFGEVMARHLFYNVGANEHPHSILLRSVTASSEDLKVYANIHNSSADSEVAVAVVTFAVNHSPDFVLETLGDEHTHLEWEAGLTKLCAFRKHYSTGGDPRNNISVSSMIDSGSNEMLIKEVNANLSGSNEMLIKEVNVNRSGSLVLWSTLSLKAFDIMSQRGTPKDPLLISGFSIAANGHTAATNAGGSVITLVLRKLVEGNQPLQEKRQQSIKAITFAINQTVGRVKQALENHQPPSPGGDWPTGK